MAAAGRRSQGAARGAPTRTRLRYTAGMFASADLVTLAERIDAERAREARRELGADRGGAGRLLALLLSVAYPPLKPVHGWQLDALERIAREGWWGARGPGEMTGLALSAIDDFGDVEAVKRGLRRATWHERARIALRELLPRELGGANLELTAYELSALAEVMVELALVEASRHVAARFGEPVHASSGEASGLVVLGMGKLGGSELNCGSDVDLIFVYDADGLAGELSSHEHWTRVARRLTQTLEEPTEDGSVWRVDLRLRPEGSQGALVNSVAAAERYYETWGRMWERAALLRSRAIAGDRELGALLEREVVQPFVYRRRVDPSIASSMIELTHRAQVELSEAPERDLKLGEGGIRQAEFFVQALQLIWGGAEPSLRTPSFAAGLTRLRAAGLVSYQEAEEVGEAYWLLRRVEHAVQWVSGLQTHLVPSEASRVAHLARVLGFADEGALAQALSTARASVAEHFAALAPEAPAPRSRFGAVLVHLEAGGLALEKAVAEALGHDDVAEHLHALARRPLGLLGSVSLERYPGLGDAVLDAVLKSADPELAGRNLRSFFQRFRDPSVYVRKLYESGNSLRRLVSVLGASQFVGDALVARPDLIDSLLFTAGAPDEAEVRQAVKDDVLAFEAWRVAAWDASPAEAREVLASALRRARMQTLVRIAVADLAGELRTRETTRLLSALADEVLGAAVRFELSEARRAAAPVSTTDECVALGDSSEQVRDVDGAAGGLSARERQTVYRLSFSTKQLERREGKQQYAESPEKRALAPHGDTSPNSCDSKLIAALDEAALDSSALQAESSLPDQEGLAVIALGKHGGRDIGYGSDLDVLFVYEPSAAPPGSYPAEFFTRVAQRVIQLISAPHAAGPGYELDTRLRPSGSQGLLVTHVGAFARYHGVVEAQGEGPVSAMSATTGAAWERQALVRARFAAGDPALAARLIAVAERAAYEGGAPPPEELHRRCSRRRKKR